MNEFAATLDRWQIFYATIATSSATLTGLLFVALSLERARWSQAERTEQLRIARGSLSDFLFVLMIALVFLVPDQTRGGFVLAILVITLARGGGLLGYVVRPQRRRRADLGHRVRDVALPLAAVVGLAAVALSVLNGIDDALYGLVAVLAALVGRATWTAWILLVGED
jgi:hypothetical protein